MLDTSEIRSSPLADLVTERLGGRTYLQERTVTVGTSIIQVLENNPNRLAYDLINESANDIRVSTDSTITATSGWLVVAKGGLFGMVYYDDGEGVGQALYAIAAAAGSVVRVREVIRL